MIENVKNVTDGSIYAMRERSRYPSVKNGFARTANLHDRSLHHLLIVQCCEACIIF